MKIEIKYHTQPPAKFYATVTFRECDGIAIALVDDWIRLHTRNARRISYDMWMVALPADLTLLLLRFEKCAS